MQQTISNDQAILISIFFAIIIAFGSFLNVLIVVTYWKQKEALLRKPKHAFLLSLAVGNLVLSLLVIPLAFASTVSRKWTTGLVGCVYYEFMTTCVSLASMLQLMVMAIDRHSTLTNLPELKKTDKTRASLAIVGCWAVAFVTSCLRLLQLGWSEYTAEDYYGFRCSLLPDSRNSYTLFLLVAFFIVPMVVTVVSYIKIYLTVRAMHLSAREIWNAQAKATIACYAAEVRTAKLLLAVITGFLFAWTPYVIVFILKIGGVELSVSYHEFPALCSKLFVICNPLIYFFSDRSLRVKATETFRSVVD